MDLHGGKHELIDNHPGVLVKVGSFDRAGRFKIGIRLEAVFLGDQEI